MLLSYDELVQFAGQGFISGVQPEHINAASIDLYLGDTIYAEAEPQFRGHYRAVDMEKRDSLEWYHAAERMREGHFDLAPGEFILAHTRNVFNMPDDMSAEFSLKSSHARNGLGHQLAGWIDPGFNGSTLTLELTNNSRYHTLRLRPGMPIGQIKVFRHAPVPAHASYRTKGRYNADIICSPIKP